jgi:hypothetical protein
VRLPTTACPTPPPSVAYALYLRDRRISLYIAAICAHYSFSSNWHGDYLKERAALVRAR